MPAVTRPAPAGAGRPRVGLRGHRVPAAAGGRGDHAGRRRRAPLPRPHRPRGPGGRGARHAGAATRRYCRLLNSWLRNVLDGLSNK